MFSNIIKNEKEIEPKYGRLWNTDLGWLAQPSSWDEGESILKMNKRGAPEIHDVSKDLLSSGYYLERELFGSGVLAKEEWSSFASSWDNLELDDYMQDGGTYRHRSYMTMRWKIGDDDGVMKMPYMPLFRASTYNSFAGGVRRYFKPMENYLMNNEYFLKSVEYALGIFSQCEADLGRTDQDWFIDVDQYRIDASKESSGEPTPEGVHSDGTNYFMLMLIDRNNVEGGISSLYDVDMNHKVTTTLQHAGDIMLLDDENMMHGVTSINSIGELHGKRDIFHISCTNINRPGSAERRFGLSTGQISDLLNTET